MKALWIKLSVKGMLNSQMIHHKMEGSGICHTMEFTTLSKQSDDASQNGRVWYLPHHGVYHCLKPENIRIVFDFSCEYRGRSIRKEVLAGPDLTNQIFGTLIKLRQDKLAFVTDIEKMFFQVYVSNENLRLLRFLWWQDGDISREPVDHEMYVFGGSLSPSCSNYALKRKKLLRLCRIIFTLMTF